MIYKHNKEQMQVINDLQTQQGTNTSDRWFTNTTRNKYKWSMIYKHNKEQMQVINYLQTQDYTDTLSKRAPPVSTSYQFLPGNGW